MIRETLEALRPGTRSFPEMASQLNIGLEDLRQRMNILESGGYVQKAIGGACPPSSCRGCGSGGCSSRSAGSAQGATVYVITEKGKRALERN